MGCKLVELKYRKEVGEYDYFCKKDEESAGKFYRE